MKGKGRHALRKGSSHGLNHMKTDCEMKQTIIPISNCSSDELTKKTGKPTRQILRTHSKTSNLREGGTINYDSARGTVAARLTSST